MSLSIKCPARCGRSKYIMSKNLMSDDNGSNNKSRCKRFLPDFFLRDDGGGRVCCLCFGHLGGIRGRAADTTESPIGGSSVGHGRFGEVGATSGTTSPKSTASSLSHKPVAQQLYSMPRCTGWRRSKGGSPQTRSPTLWIVSMVRLLPFEACPNGGSIRNLGLIASNA